MSAARSRRANDKHNHLQRTPILVMGCSLLIACCIAFGGTNWTASAQPSEDQLPEQNAIVEPGYYQETIGSYEAISQSDDDERAENLRLAAEAINGYVIEPGATFSFNEVVGDTTAERGYKEAPVLYSSGLGSSDGGGICQVSTALYIAAVKADLEIVERHPHSVPPHSISIQSSAPSRVSRSTMAQNSSRMLSSSLLPTSYSSTTAANPLLICVRLKTTRAMLLQLLRQARQQPNLLRLHSLLHLPLTQTAFLTRMLYSSTSSLARH